MRVFFIIAYLCIAKVSSRKFRHESFAAERLQQKYCTHAKKEKGKAQNPFVYLGYEGPDYFCDRTEETERMISGLTNGRNFTLVSPRKMGKTGLVKHVFHHISAQQKDAVCLYLDIFATSNLQEFVELFCSSFVADVVERTKSFIGKALLRAIARDEPVAQPQSNSFISRNNLPSPSTVK